MTDLAARRLCLLFTPELCRDDPWRTLDTCLAAGVPLVQWRVKDRDDAGLRRCLELCAEHDVPVIVNDHVDLAVSMRCAGAHVGQEDMPASAARARLGPERILGVSTHDVDQALGAQSAGCDYMGLGPCFPTRTKGYEEGISRVVIREVLAAAHVPVFAIGGITGENATELLDCGLRNFAVSSSVLAAHRPADAVTRLLHAVSL